jgi:Uma2 family endonuclease
MNVASQRSPFEPKKPRRVPFETFIKKYEKGWNGYKYEWNDGIIEKTIAMKQNELYIIRNLTLLFMTTQASQNGGWLMPEVEVWTSTTQWRKPDIAFFTKEQIRAGENNQNSIPPFVIEVLSTFDPINIVTNKLIEYFKAGVQVVWHIFPEQQMVYVFTSPKHVTICEGEDICSAAPALPDFTIAARDIFRNE